jgi:hypothetical protein
MGVPQKMTIDQTTAVMYFYLFSSYYDCPEQPAAVARKGRPA